MNFRFHMPVKLLVGSNSVTENYQELVALGKSCLVVTGHNSAKLCGALQDAITALDKAAIRYQIFDQVTQNPYLSTCVEAGRMARDMKAEFILGIGGGSPLDAAKAIAVFATNHGLQPNNVFDRNWAHDPLPIALIGTTAGTGSEATQYSVLTLDDSHRKSSIADPRCFAAVAFGDPRYTASLSSRFTLSTGLDALSHCVESYFNKTADPCSDLFALEGARLAVENLKQVVGKEPQEIPLTVRSDLYTASLYAGIAIARTGTAYCHALGYFLTEEFDIPHGFACATLLPSYLADSAAYMPEKVEAFKAAVGLGCEELAALIESLTATEITKDQLPRLTVGEVEAIVVRFTGNGNLKKSPGDVTPQKTMDILSALFIG